MKHFKNRVDKMTQKATSRKLPIAMFIRIIILAIIITIGKFSCEWAVEKSVNHPKEQWEERRTGQFNFQKGN